MPHLHFSHVTLNIRLIYFGLSNMCTPTHSDTFGHILGSDGSYGRQSTLVVPTKARSGRKVCDVTEVILDCAGNRAN